MPDRENFPTNKNVVAPPKPPIWPFRSKFVSLSMRRYTNGRPSVHRNTGRTAAPPHETMKNSKPIAITLMSILSLFGCGPSKAPEYPSDQLTARDGTRFTITFFKHASLSISAGGKYIYVDPVGANADYAALPKADIVLITHSHYDHLDVAAVEKLLAPDTEILCDRTSAEAFEMNCYTMRPGSVATPRDWVKVEAVAAYNTTPGHLQFHPKEREDCGYILTVGGTRIYIAGDTEPTPEMRALRDIDIAFLPVNQPYTMTVEQAAEAVKALRPAIFYPYHYGEAEEKTDIDRLVRETEGLTEIRVRPME